MSGKITDKKEALALLKEIGWVLSTVSDELQADKELVMVAVKDIPYALQFASDELQNDPEILDGLDN